MSRWDKPALRVAVLCVALSLSLAALAGGKYKLGRPATEQEIAGWDIDVRPDGEGLPIGKGSVDQGQQIYDQKCASCHGSFGESNSYMVIAGGVGTLGTRDPLRSTGSKLQYATTLFDYIRRAMPFANPQSLTADEVYALTAYVLHLSDIVPTDTILDQVSLPQVAVPNAKGFTVDHGLMKLDGRPDTQNTDCMKDCAKDVKIISELPENAKKAPVKTTGVRPAIEVAAIKPNGDVPAPSSAGTGNPADLIQRHGCAACHGLDSKIVGPSFQEIATKYKAASGAADHLISKIRAGGSGVWGSVLMPAQPQVSEAEAVVIVKWLMAGARAK